MPRNPAVRCPDCGAYLDGGDCDFCARFDAVLEAPFDEMERKRRVAIKP